MRQVPTHQHAAVHSTDATPFVSNHTLNHDSAYCCLPCLQQSPGCAQSDMRPTQSIPPTDLYVCLSVPVAVSHSRRRASSQHDSSRSSLGLQAT